MSRATTEHASGKHLAAISTGLVQLHSRYWGMGPTRAKTHIDGDILVCFLRDPYTVSERTLLHHGQAEAVELMRDSLAEAMDGEARVIVEENCGREVIAHLSTLHADPDIVAEIFILEAEEELAPPA